MGTVLPPASFFLVSLFEKLWRDNRDELWRPREVGLSGPKVSQAFAGDIDASKAGADVVGGRARRIGVASR